MNVMIKFICDKCLEETTKASQIHKRANGTNKRYDLCPICAEKWDLFHTHIANVDIEDFIRLTNKEMDFLFSTFQVGDEVITSTGQVGVIKDICTCDRCKERGFYEPCVEMKTGNGPIYITDNDKRDGFSNFYKIGDRMFGNLDEEAVLDSIKWNKEEIERLTKERYKLLDQLDIVKCCKNKEVDNNE